MKTPQLTDPGLLARIGSLFILFLVVPGYAQWPTTYTAPKIVGSGTSTWAGDVMATPDGGVVMATDQIVNSARKPVAALFNAAGEQETVEFELYDSPAPLSQINLFPAETPALFGISLGHTQKSIDDLGLVFLYREFAPDGNDVPYSFNNFWFAYEGHWISQDAKLNIESNLVSTFYNPWDGYYGLMMYLAPLPVTLGELELGERIDDAVVLPMTDTISLGCFVKSGPQPEIPTELWLTYYQWDGNENCFMQAPHRVPAESGVAQSHPQFTAIGSEQAMLTWIGKRDHDSKLRAKVVNFVAAEVSGARDILDDCVDYKAIPTTLGLPVFAALQQDDSVYPPVNTLIGGLVNPTNGGTLTIPIASGTGVKLKALQQESNGDFSVAYSVIENGTNLLKVRRISGVSAATLWETTVADLGLASDAEIEEHPNAWISGAADGVLYVLARYDQPGTANSTFQLVRLRADGTMGAD